MRILNKLAMLSFMAIALTTLAGCAAGAATAGYSLRAHEADSLSAQAEQRIIDRAKREIMVEYMGHTPGVHEGL